MGRDPWLESTSKEDSEAVGEGKHRDEGDEVDTDTRLTV